MSGSPIGPKIFPAAVDLPHSATALDDGLALPVAAVFVDYSETEPDRLARVRVFDSSTTLVLDAAVVDQYFGEHPKLVSDRHRLTLDDGRVLLIQAQGGCGCGSKLKAFNPNTPASSGRRP